MATKVTEIKVKFLSNITNLNKCAVRSWRKSFLQVTCTYLYIFLQWYASEDVSSQLSIIASAQIANNEFVKAGGHLILLQGQKSFGMYVLFGYLFNNAVRYFSCSCFSNDLLLTSTPSLLYNAFTSKVNY